MQFKSTQVVNAFTNVNASDVRKSQTLTEIDFPFVVVEILYEF